MFKKNHRKVYHSTKIEKIREFLKHGELTINEIAFELNYSSPQYLSNQFKEITGLRPSQFRNMLESERKQLNKV
ncbi:MAG: helix-turn-helix domain-containing protein [Flavobacteriales bacterium]|nr:helix-turn-helix domain-containing protein [Flavobacteriales bacterium]